MTVTSAPVVSDHRLGKSARFIAWLDKRIPPARQHKLTQKNVFIFPSRAGFGYSAFIVLLVVGAINYQSSLFFGVAFLILACTQTGTAGCWGPWD